MNVSSNQHYYILWYLPSQTHPELKSKHSDNFPNFYTVGDGYNLHLGTKKQSFLIELKISDSTSIIQGNTIHVNIPNNIFQVWKS